MRKTVSFLAILLGLMGTADAAVTSPYLSYSEDSCEAFGLKSSADAQAWYRTVGFFMNFNSGASASRITST